MHLRVSQFLREESGATAIEYGLIASLIFLVIISAVKAFATNATAMFFKISSNV
jgi:pilus assembly protein Flp/PilA